MKKNFKLILALVLSIMMVLAMGATAFAVEGMKLTYTGAGATENGNISVSNATKDTTYTLYKIFDATYDAADATKVSYTIKAGDLKNELTTNGGDYFVIGATADGNGNFSVSRKMQAAPNADKPVKTDAELLAYLKGLNTSLFTDMGNIKANANGKIDFEKVPYGYFMIVPDKPAPGALVTIDTNTPTVTVIDKNNKPEFDKNIVIAAANASDASTLQKWSESGMDIAVPFQIDLTAQNYDGEDKIFKYRITDALDPGFTLTVLPTVTLNGTALGTDKYSITYKTAAEGNAVTVTDVASAATAQYFEIDIPWTSDGTINGTHLYDPNAAVQVTYTAKLDPAKKDEIKVGNIANDNKADVKYFKDGETPDTDTPSGDLPDKTTKSWETSLTIQKTDEQGNALTGAEFTLTTTNGTQVSYVYNEEYVEAADGTYWKLKDGTYTTQDPDGTGEDGNPIDKTLYESTETKYKLQKTGGVKGAGQTNTSIVGVVGADGKVTFSGLGTGTYKLVETKVPDGYNKADDIDFTINFAMDSGFQATDSNGKPNQPTDADGKFSATPDNVIVLRGTANVFDTTVVNKKGVELPSTGGIGTTIFYVAGSILVLAAAVLLITKRRMGAND